MAFGLSSGRCRDGASNAREKRRLATSPRRNIAPRYRARRPLRSRARCVEVLAIFFAVAAAYALVGVALFAPEYRRARLEVEFGAAFTTPQVRPRSFVR